jgi:2-hydroxychromene-2-carboxylate isomerase
MSPRAVDFFFDLSSPYSYLASTQIERVAAGAGVRFRPMVLSAVFKAANNVMPAKSPPKAKWMIDDLARWARHYGVPFHYSDRFPVNAMKGHRMIVACDDEAAQARLSHRLFSALWVDDRDLTADEVLIDAARLCDLDGPSLLKQTEQPAVKGRLRENTDEAIRRGAFGAPAIFVGDQLFWGNDRLLFVAEALLDVD